MRRAWSRLRERHPVLRAVFVAVSATETVQVVLKSSETESCYDYDEDNADEEAFDINNHVRQLTNKSMDLSKPPVYLRLVRHPTQDIILLKLHHAVYDAWTLPILLTDLAALYKSTTLPPLPDYPSSITSLTQSLQREREPEKAYWRHSLHSCQRTLPPNNTNPADSAHSSINHLPLAPRRNPLPPPPRTSHASALDLPLHHHPHSLRAGPRPMDKYAQPVLRGIPSQSLLFPLPPSLHLPPAR